MILSYTDLLSLCGPIFDNPYIVVMCSLYIASIDA